MPDVARQCQAALEAGRIKYGLNHLGIALVRPNRPDLSLLVGADGCDGGQGRPIQTGSLAKLVTALSVFDMVEAGEISLDDRVDVPCRDDMGPPRIDALLGHQTGLPFWTPLAEPPSPAWSAVDPALVPQGGLKYSNLGYALLGTLIAQSTSQSYTALARQRVPVDLTWAGVTPADGEITGWQGRAHLNALPYPGLPRRAAHRPEVNPAVSGLRMDLAGYCALLRHVILRKDSPLVARMLGDGPMTQSGFGLRRRNLLGQPAATLMCYAFGHSAYLVFLPSAEVGLLVIADQSGAQIPLAEIAHEIVAALIGAVPPGNDETPRRLAPFCGTYTSPCGLPWEVTQQDGHLHLAIGDTAPLRLTRALGSVFRAERGLSALVAFGPNAAAPELVSVGAQWAARVPTTPPPSGLAGRYAHPLFGEIEIADRPDGIFGAFGIETARATPLSKNRYRIGPVAFYSGEVLRTVQTQDGTISAISASAQTFERVQD